MKCELTLQPRTVWERALGSVFSIRSMCVKIKQLHLNVALSPLQDGWCCELQECLAHTTSSCSAGETSTLFLGGRIMWNWTILWGSCSCLMRRTTHFRMFLSFVDLLDQSKVLYLLYVIARTFYHWLLCIVLKTSYDGGDGKLGIALLFFTLNVRLGVWWVCRLEYPANLWNHPRFILGAWFQIWS